jgi:hypothetical protein
VAGQIAVPRDAYAAKQAKVPVAVGSFAGPQQTKVRKKVLDVLRKSGSYEVTDAEDIKPGGNKKAYASMASALGSNAIIVGVISKRFNLTLTVYDANGARLDAVEIKGGGGSFGLLKAIDNELEISIADPIARAKSGGKPAPVKAEPKPEPKPKAEKKPKADEEEEPEISEEGEIDEGSAESGDSGEESGEEGDSEDEGAEVSAPSEPSEPGLRPLEVMAGLRGYSRQFEYTDPQRNTDLRGTELHPYRLPLGPAILVALRFYPAALFMNNALSHVGITGRYELGIATGTNYTERDPMTGQDVTTNLATSSATWQAGLRGRLPIGAHELGVFAEYGSHAFVLRGDENPSLPNKPYALVPDVNYVFIRTGLDARLHFRKVVLGGHVAPRFLQSLREIDTPGIWFPAATGSGLDFGLMGGYSILPYLSVVGGLDVLRYGFDFNRMPDCLPMSQRCAVAGGATDTYLSGWLAAMLHLDGSAAKTP